MEFITDFISNQATLLISVVVVLAFIAKLIISYVSKDKTVIIPASELIDNIADKVIDEIKDIKAEREKRGLVPPLDITIPMPAVKPPRLDNPNVKEGFNIIKQPSNPNRNSDNSEDSNSDDDEEEYPYRRGGKVKDSCVVGLKIGCMCNDGIERETI